MLLEFKSELVLPVLLDEAGFELLILESVAEAHFAHLLGLGRLLPLNLLGAFLRGQHSFIRFQGFAILNLPVEWVDWKVDFVIEQLHRVVPYLKEQQQCESRFVDGPRRLKGEDVYEEGDISCDQGA